MNDITPISGPSAASLNSTVAAARVRSAVGTPTRTSDSAEISQVAQLLSKLTDLDIRQDKVDAVRAQIEAGTYLTSDKIDAAVEELLSDLS